MHMAGCLAVGIWSMAMMGGEVSNSGVYYA